MIDKDLEGQSTFPDMPGDIPTRRLVEALLFASAEPLTVADLATRLPAGADIEAALNDIKADFVHSGFELAQVAGGYMFRTAEDLAFLLREEVETQRKLSRAGVETMAIIAYLQPVTRAEIESIRGVSISKGTLDVLVDAGWVTILGRRRTPGRPVTYGTTDDFLIHFGLESLSDLPGLADLQAAGLLDSVDDAMLQEEAARADKEDQQIDLEDVIDAADRAVEQTDEPEQADFEGGEIK